MRRTIQHRQASPRALASGTASIRRPSPSGGSADRRPMCRPAPRAASVYGAAIARAIDRVSVWRKSRQLSAKPMGSDYNSRLNGGRAWPLGRIAAVSDLTPKEIHVELAARCIPVGCGTVLRFFAAEGVRFRKSCTPASWTSWSGLTVPSRALPGKRINPMSIRAAYLDRRVGHFHQDGVATQALRNGAVGSFARCRGRGHHRANDHAWEARSGGGAEPGHTVLKLRQPSCGLIVFREL